MAEKCYLQVRVHPSTHDTLKALGAKYAGMSISYIGRKAVRSLVQAHESKTQDLLWAGGKVLKVAGDEFPEIPEGFAVNRGRPDADGSPRRTKILRLYMDSGLRDRWNRACFWLGLHSSVALEEHLLNWVEEFERVHVNS